MAFKTLYLTLYSLHLNKINEIPKWSLGICLKAVDAEISQADWFVLKILWHIALA